MFKPSILLHILLISLLFIAVMPLHLKMHLAIANYIASVKQNYDGIGEKLDSLENSQLKIMESYQSGVSLDEKLSAIQALFSQEKADLTQLQKLLIKPINQSQWACPQIPSEQLQQYNILLGGLNSQLDTLSGTISNLTDTHLNPELEQTIQNLKDELDSGEQALYAVGASPSNVQTPSTEYKTNLVSSNWLITNTTLDQISKQYVSSSETIKICPLDKPYSDGSKCIACEEEGHQYFSIQKKVCVSCKNFDKQEHKCLDTYGSNILKAGNRIILPEGQTLEGLSADIICFENQPFYTGQKCIQCAAPTTLFNYSSKTCSQCDSTKIFNQTTHSCQKITKFFINFEDQSIQNKIILLENSSFDTVSAEKQKLAQVYNVQVCPTDTPFLGKDQACISCDGLFDYSRKQCGQCPQNHYYAADSHHCIAILYYNDLKSANNWVLTTKTQEQIQQQIKTASQKSGAKQCPSSTPYFNGESCITCQGDTVFDVEALTCKSCGQSQYFSETIHRCQKIYEKEHQTNPDTAANLIYAQKTYNYWMRQYYSNLVDNQVLPDCPQDSPYWSVHSCIACPNSRPYFNMSTQKCQQCADGYTYSSDKHECVSGSGEIQQ